MERLPVVPAVFGINVGVSPVLDYFVRGGFGKCYCQGLIPAGEDFGFREWCALLAFVVLDDGAEAGDEDNDLVVGKIGHRQVGIASDGSAFGRLGLVPDRLWAGCSGGGWCGLRVIPAAANRHQNQEKRECPHGFALARGADTTRGYVGLQVPRVEVASLDLFEGMGHNPSRS
jgi:hypothetical protein